MASIASVQMLSRAASQLRIVLTIYLCAASLASSGSAQAEPSARAEPSASDRATARSLAGEGYTALKKKDYTTAEDRFRRADELVHAPTLVVDHARALAGLGRFGEAYEAYQSVVQEEIPADAPTVWKRAAKEAQRELDTLLPRVAWLTIRVKGPSEPQVTVDGRPLSPSALGQRRPANPGERSVLISAPGFIAQESKQLLTEGAETTLEVELLPEPKPKPVVVIAPPIQQSPAQVEGEQADRRQRTLAYVSLGVSGLGFAVGTATGILWLKARSDVKSACGGLSCSAASSSEEARFEDDKHRYNTYGTLSGVGFAVGVVGAATGAALLIWEPSSEHAKGTTIASIKPYLGPASAGVYGAF